MDSFSPIKAPIESELAEFKQLFDNSVSGPNALLNDVVSHIRRRNGKLMRPVLVLLMARLHGAISPATYHTAVSLELLHTASLVHDDVVDESSERRGQLSVNAVFNNKVAVLSGDYLLATSLMHAELTQSHPIIRLIAELGRDLSDGELLQLSNVSNLDFSEAVYFEVIRKKTAALFATCAQAAALSAGETDGEALELARLFGERLGVCFQIKDDIFDYFDSKEIGKPTGNDMLEGKLTLPVLYALNRTNDDAARQIAARVKEGKASCEEIGRLVAFTKANGGIAYAERRMNDYKREALEALEGMASFPVSDVTRALVAYLDYVVDREK
ncbi:MAG: polyprenyl synthetase family protein [Mediterranea sp.]|jgi:octaprenyl-diphosphate synthase|nr:polyprenyl synthetase family protein [Mediterranea sp.]